VHLPELSRRQLPDAGDVPVLQAELRVRGVRAMSMLTIGIDPGLTGAIAFLGPSGELEHLADLPVIRDGKLAWIDAQGLTSTIIDTLRGRPARAVIERVNAFPGQGRSSAFNFGVSFGSLLALVQARYLPIELVTPAVWKRAMGLGSDKRASLNKARLLYPMAELDLAKHDGRAEALLLAHFAYTRNRT
jgi:crossover junction endodeoxyribonuclease RuvC